MVSDPLHFASDPLQPPPRSAHLFWAAGQPGAGTCQSAPPPRCALSLTFPCPLRLSRLYKAGFRNWGFFCFLFFHLWKKKEDTDFFFLKRKYSRKKLQHSSSPFVVCLSSHPKVRAPPGSASSKVSPAVAGRAPTRRPGPPHACTRFDVRTLQSSGRSPAWKSPHLSLHSPPLK